MPDRFTPDDAPQLPTELDAPRPGETVGSALHRAAIKAVLNLAKWVQLNVRLKSEAVNADTLDNLDSSQFWKKSEQLPASGSSNAETLDGLDSSEFWKKSEAVNATRLQGYSAAEFVLKSEGGAAGINGVTVYEVSGKLRLNAPLFGGGVQTLLMLPSYINAGGLQSQSIRYSRLRAFRLNVSGLSSSGTASSVVEVRAMAQIVAPPSDANSVDLTLAQYSAAQASGNNYGRTGLNIPLSDPLMIVVYNNADAGARLDSGEFTFWGLIEVTTDATGQTSTGAGGYNSPDVMPPQES